jgi:conjugative relaxase-like TrwC/TraI family protein
LGVVAVKTQYNLKNAKEYFEEHLCVGDYYNEGDQVTGEWFGQGGERLGLSGKVRADEFLRLCENQHPATSGTLTQRLDTTRVEDGEKSANRRIFNDFTFSPPKSVSLVALAGKDGRIVEDHGRAVRSALREFEAFASTRVRAGGGNSDRQATYDWLKSTFGLFKDASNPSHHSPTAHCSQFNSKMILGITTAVFRLHCPDNEV